MITGDVFQATLRALGERHVGHRLPRKTLLAQLQTHLGFNKRQAEFFLACTAHLDPEGLNNEQADQVHNMILRADFPEEALPQRKTGRGSVR